MGAFCRSYGTGTSKRVEVRCRNPLVLLPDDLIVHRCFVSSHWYIYVFLLFLLSDFVFQFIFESGVRILDRAGFSFHSHRNAPGWVKWICLDADYLCPSLYPIWYHCLASKSFLEYLYIPDLWLIALLCLVHGDLSPFGVRFFLNFLYFWHL